MNTTPVASSSRVRLDDWAVEPPSSPPPSPPSFRRRRALRRSANVVAFVLALSAPYLVSAAPAGHALGSRRGHVPIDGLVAAATGNTGNTTVQTTSIDRLYRFPSGTILQREATEGRLLKLSFDFAMVKEPNGAVLIDGKYYELQPTMNAGFIVLSYLIALVGSLCTLELLIRRTSNRGASNLVLLALAGICFGAVSTFAMHFVGNQSLALHFPDVPGFEGYKPLYLSYLGGLTVLSFVVSCLAMTFAFFVMGTDIKWRTLPCFGGRKNADDRGARDDYNRWKLQKSRLGKASVPSIFQQAGMGANWPNNQQQTRRGWKPWLFGDSSPDSPMTFAPDLDPDEDQDEDSLVKHDKELGEIDFRFGRMAVRDAIDRRQTARDGGSPMDSALQTPEASIVGVESPMTELPTSPLAAYYPTNGAREIAAPIDIRSPPSPNGVFTPGYQFPPRDAEPTASLIPRPRSGIIMGWTGPPAEALVPRRGSLPASVLPAVPQRLAQNTLSRIQSLPEHDNEPPIRRYSIDTKEEPHNSCSDETEDHHVRLGSVDPLPYEDEDDEQRTTLTGWRTRLRSKVQSGLPLTPLEKVVRFVGLDVVTSSDIIKISLTGMLAGWGVAAMHYIGQFSIDGIPYVAYDVGYVVGSVIIASGAVIIALYIMFIMLRPKLKHSWMSKIGVAILLAGAVCGMHYCAMLGTIYGWDVGRVQEHTGNRTKHAITGIVAALAFVACIGVAVFIMIDSIRDRKERARRRRVVVASVLLDEQDRMLVSAIDGLLPMCDIASLTPAETKSKANGANGGAATTQLGVDLTTGNDAFVQAMRMSWTWRNPFSTSLERYAPASDAVAPDTPMLIKTPSLAGDGLLASRRASAMTAAESLSSAIIASRANVSRFLEKFAISATQLSVRLTGQTEGISRLGVLYDQILTTGWVRIQNGEDTVSKGQLIFLVRRVKSSQERSDLLSRHFIFADPLAVATSLHRTLSTPFEHVMPFLEDMRSFCDNTMRMQLRPNTLYAGVVIVQATPFDGLRILLNNHNRSQLPMREVCTFSTLPGLPVNVAEGLAGTLEEIGEAVTWLDGMNLLSVISRNMSAEATRVGGPRVGRLLTALERAVVPMLDELLSVEDMAYILPRLQLHPVLVPLTPAAPARKGTPGWAPPHIVVFYANYDFAVNTFDDKWLPFKLFRAQHECVMSAKIDAITRAAAETTPKDRNTPRAPSPALSPVTSQSGHADPAKYNYGRRPSKVQFEVPPSSEPPMANYSFPPREGAISASSMHGSTNGSAHGHGSQMSYSKSGGCAVPSPTANSFPAWSTSRGVPRRSSLARSVHRDEPAEPAPLVRPGVAQWDSNWLLSLLRTRLRADA